MTTSSREKLTPQMLQYADKFDDRGDIRWLPYLMYFHETDHRSAVVNTDSLGFRFAEGPTGRASPGDAVPPGAVRLMAGSSTVFGIGATHDGATLPSRLWSRHAPAAAWLNFAGRSHNATQELLLYVLYRHLVPRVSEIVLFSGFNNLGLSRLPARLRGDHGGFFNSAMFQDQIDRLRDRRRPLVSWLRGGGSRRSAEEPPGLDEQIRSASEITLRHLDTWRLLAEGIGARLTFVLQPLAPWVRDRGAPEEELLFRELDEIADFSRAYGDVASPDAGRRYSKTLEQGCGEIGVRFLDFTPVLADAVGPEEWIFVDRIHFTDAGYDLVARLLAESLELS